MSIAFKVLLALGGCLVFGLTPPCGYAGPDLEETPDRPNIVFILTDDLDTASSRKIPELEELFGDEGTTFENAFVTHSLCCPSRSTILTGQYSHNHLVRRNTPPLGGYQVFRELGREKSTIATWLDGAGYKTAFFGKYMNGYGKSGRTHVPTGWDEWYGEVDYAKVNHNGRVVKYPADTYHDDALSGLAQGFVKRQRGDDAPLFLYLSVHSPHAPAEPARRYKDLFKGERAPRTPSFNEADVSDKPEWVQSPLLTASEKRRIDELYLNRLRTMAAVGEMARGVIKALEETGRLDNTYLIFTSDNGYHMGQHRLALGKDTAYEEDIRIPLMIRGPGVPAGAQREEMVLNNDFAPTLADLAGVKPPGSTDGRSFVSLLDETSENDPASWRTAFEVRHWGDEEELARPSQAVRAVPSYQAVRTLRHLYVEYETGERELYDLNADPDQLENLHGSADPALLASLKSRLEALRDCAGESCRVAEDGPSNT